MKHYELNFSFVKHNYRITKKVRIVKSVQSCFDNGLETKKNRYLILKFSCGLISSLDCCLYIIVSIFVHISYGDACQVHRRCIKHVHFDCYYYNLVIFRIGEIKNGKIEVFPNFINPQPCYLFYVIFSIRSLFSFSFQNEQRAIDKIRN